MNKIKTIKIIKSLKILTIAAVFFLVVSLLSACGKTGQNTESVQSEQTEHKNDISEQSGKSNEKADQSDINGLSEEADATDEKKSEIIEKLVIGHATYGDDAFEEEGRLLDELSSIDELSGVKWKKIMDYWRSTEEGVELNKGVLPDGLPDDNRLCIVALGFQLNADGSMKDELFDRLNVVLASAEKYPN